MQEAKKQKEVLNKKLSVNGKKDCTLKLWVRTWQAAIEAEAARCCEEI